MIRGSTRNYAEHKREAQNSAVKCGAGWGNHKGGCSEMSPSYVLKGN